VLGLVGIDREVERPAFEPAGSGVDQRVLCPDAGMMELSLMPGRKEDFVIVMTEPLPHMSADFWKGNLLDKDRLCGGQSLVCRLRIAE